MKFNYVILGFLFIMSATSNDSSELSESSCNSDDWVFTHVTLKWTNETKHIVMSEIPPKDTNKKKLYEAHIIINDCKNHTSCGKVSKVFVDNFECKDKACSELYNACEIKKKVAELENREQWLTRNSENGKELYNQKFCVNLDDSNSGSSS